MHPMQDRIKTRMGELGTSINSLADATAISRMTLTRRITDPAGFTLGELDRVAAALDVSVLWLLGTDAA